MFSRILIANRGEIACRVIKTARRMGVKTVAVYSDADANALHVEMADQATRIGPPPVSESYLRMDAIIEAARETGAQAIHPGYGFLSENPDFVEKVEEAGLVFIGPSAKSIRAMGLKDAAKIAMEKAGVPVVPGYHGEAQETVVLAGKANEIGYPVLIKARAGGGGKGMRKVERAEDFREALASAKREARSSFGDERVLVEKFVEKPRHIEVQVFGDNQGNVVHLFERDCSLQRRHQKVIEEAPAPGMTPEMREAMTQAAVDAASAIHYSGAGTIEFIVDGSQGLRTDGFWFMEMNTRLQVEHPVTECITGLDLVEWQLRVASGERLPLEQEQIALNGHAFEARIYAEDAARGFLPATGTLHHLRFPQDARIDTGVRQGDAISPHYDPMIAKLITYGPDRESALNELQIALRQTQIGGTTANVAFLAALAEDIDFNSGDVDTGLIERNADVLTAPAETPTEARALAALASLGLLNRNADSDPFDSVGSWSLWQPLVQFADLEENGERYISQISANETGWSVSTPETEISLSVGPSGDGEYAIKSTNGHTHASLARWPGHIAVFMHGSAFEFGVVDPFLIAEAQTGGADNIVAPMTGLAKLVQVAVGEKVKAGASLIVLEAMKMEHSLVAPRDGVVAAVNLAEGDQVEEGSVLVSLEPEDAV